MLSCVFSRRDASNGLDDGKPDDFKRCALYDYEYVYEYVYVYEYEYVYVYVYVYEYEYEYVSTLYLYLYLPFLTPFQLPK